MQISKEISKAYVEVLAVIDKLEEEDYNKIPKERLELYSKIRDKDYIFEYNNDKPMDEQISDKAKAILANLFIKYIATEDERKVINNKHRNDFMKVEEQKKSIVLNELFKTESKVVQPTNNIKTELMVVEKNNIFVKILETLKNIFNWRK